MDKLADDLENMPRVPLADDHVSRLHAIGTEKEYDAGDLVADAGEAMDRFVYVLDGEIEVVDPYTGECLLPDTLFLAYRRVNALRELGQFDEARTALALISADPAQGEDLAWLAEQIPLMRAVIDTGDRSRVPYSLVPEDVANLRCAYEAEQGLNPAGWCLDPQHQDSVQKDSREPDEMEEFRETILREIGLM